MGWFSSPRNDVVRINEAVAASFQKVKLDVSSIHEWINFLHKQNDYQQHLLEWQATEVRQLREKVPSKEGVKDIIRKEAKYIKTELEESNEILQRKVRRDLQHTHASIKLAVRRELEQVNFSHIFEQLRSVSARMNELEPIAERLYDVEHKLRDIPSNEKLNEAFNKLEELNKKIEDQRGVVAPQPVMQMPQPQMQYPTPDQAMSNLQRKVLKRVQRNSKEYVKSVMLSIVKRYHQINGLQVKEMVVDEQGLVSKSSLYRLLNELVDEGRINVQQDGKEKIYSFVGSATEENPKL